MPLSWVKVASAWWPASNSTGVVLENSVALTDISPGAATVGKAFTTLQHSVAFGIGDLLRFTAAGNLSSTTGTNNLELGLYYGGVAGVALAKTEATTVPASITTRPWLLQATMRVIEGGTAGKALTQGYVLGIEAISALAASASVTMMPGEVGTGGEATALDFTTAKVITVGAKWSVAAAANKILCYQWMVEHLTASG